ncbi:MAG: V-type ATPase subunit subunit G family protein [Trueperaceae bacterium]
MDAQGDNLLKRLVEQERTLADKVEAAQTEAQAIVAEAREKAEAVAADARERAERIAREQRDAGQKEADAERSEIVAGAESAVASVRQAAEARRDDAVKLVLERVLP